jgi:hypothetical protein
MRWQINQNLSNKEGYYTYCFGNSGILVVQNNYYNIYPFFLLILKENCGWFMKIVLVLFVLLFSGLGRAQADLESDIDMAIQNAKKGIYWVLNNIPEKKIKLDNDLIAEDKLFASVKLSKEINGVKIESTGYNNSYAVTIKLFRSDESLIKDGFIKTKEKHENSEESK